MADKKISQLTALSAANLAPSTDVLAIVDTSATETKKIVAQDLINGVLNVASAVGIGTASPGAKLTVYGSSGAAYIQVQDAAGVTGKIQARASTNLLEIGTTSNNGLSLYTNNTEKALLDTSGNLGLGASPAASNYSGSYTSLLVKGNSTNKIGTVIAQSFGTANATSIEMFAGDSVNEAGLLVKGASTAMTFYTGSAPDKRMTLDASGNLLVGITGNNDPSSAIVRAGLFSGQRSGSTNTVFQAWNQATTGDNLFVQFYTEGGGGTLRGSIDYNRAGGLVRYNTTSDYRAKDVYGLLNDSGQTIDALKVYRGKMHGATMERPMLIAHEAQEAAPYAVTGEKDAVNEDGTPKFQQMDTSSLVPLLIAEIQSLRSRVAALEAK